jgi:hypothetical protein
LTFADYARVAWNEGGARRSRLLMRPGLLGLLLLLASCASGPYEPAVSTLASSPVSTVSTIQPVEGNCREYTVPITVGGKEEQAHGKACQQADGTWQIVQPLSAPDGASVPPSAVIYPAYPYAYYDPWGPPWWGVPWWGPAFGFGGFVGFSSGHHHHHRHHHH